MAAQAIGQEYRFGLIRLTLTAFPQRGRILTAKVSLVVIACSAIALLTPFAIGALTVPGIRPSRRVIRIGLLASVVPILLISAYLALAKRLGAFDAL